MYDWFQESDLMAAVREKKSLLQGQLQKPELEGGMSHVIQQIMTSHTILYLIKLWIPPLAVLIGITKNYISQVKVQITLKRAFVAMTAITYESLE